MTAYIPKRTDANQPEVMSLLRRLGFSVKSLHESGKGMFDLIIAKNGLNILVEVKDGDQYPSNRELTPAQKQFNFEWTGLRCVVTNDEDCMRLYDSVSLVIKRLNDAGIFLTVAGNLEEQYKPSLY